MTDTRAFCGVSVISYTTQQGGVSLYEPCTLWSLSKPARGERSYDIFSRLFNDRIIMLCDEVNEHHGQPCGGAASVPGRAGPGKGHQFVYQQPGRLHHRWHGHLRHHAAISSAMYPPSAWAWRLPWALFLSGGRRKGQAPCAAQQRNFDSSAADWRAGGPAGPGDGYAKFMPTTLCARAAS